METDTSKYNLASKLVAVFDLVLSMAILLWIGWTIFLGEEFLELPSDREKKQTDKIPMVLIPVASLIIGILGVVFAIRLLNATDTEVTGTTQIQKRATMRNWIKLSICICIAILVTLISIVTTSGLSTALLGGAVFAVLFKVCGIMVVYLFYKDLETNSDVVS